MKNEKKLGSMSKPRCYTNHKDLSFGNKGGLLIGASCISPREGYDIYIGFDWGMHFNHQNYPWHRTDKSVTEFQFHIADNSVPKYPKDFKKMITWVCNQLRKGKTIHAGCIGGHGRTGLFIAAVRAEYNGDKNAGRWTRENHCVNAIESKSQINFLYKYYGIKKIKPCKTEYSGWKDQTSNFDTVISRPSTSGSKNQIIPVMEMPDARKLNYVGGKGSMWG